MSRPSPGTCLDVRVLISDVIKSKDIDRYFSFHKAKDKPICYVKLKQRIPHSTYDAVYNLLMKYDAEYSSRDRLWEVPLAIKRG